LVDRALVQLSVSEKEEWDYLVRANSGYATLQAWLAERGHQVSTANLSNWWIVNQPRGEAAIALNKMTQSFIGVEGKALLQMASVHCAKLVAEMMESVNSDSIPAASIESRLTATVNLLRELRQASDALTTMQSVGDRNALVVSGRHELAEELRRIFKGSPFEEALDAGINGALIKLES
jgi:hypothetical protein